MPLMKVLSATQLNSVDLYTIQNEPITSIDLMERAALACSKWIESKYSKSTSIAVFCGQGNNGGDGLAIARLLIKSGYQVDTYVIESEGQPTPDFTKNLSRLPDYESITEGGLNQDLNVYTLLIDCLFGSGLNRPVEGFMSDVIKIINESATTKISIDIPSGLFCDSNTSNTGSIVEADTCLTLELPKLALLLPDN
ncbi:MAG: hydroxyethylthiazole kinase-like uncharacterized protein yjeF, partial [Bacteroidia bacterium]